MIQIKKILLPTDFSECANHAKLYAMELAKKFGARVILENVVMFPIYAGSYDVIIDQTTIQQQLQQDGEKRLSATAAEFAKEGIGTESIIALGSPFVEIINTARQKQCDLIIIGTHGWGGIKHLMLGSTAERVVRKSPCPVLTVRQPEHEFVHP